MPNDFETARKASVGCIMVYPLEAKGTVRGFPTVPEGHFAAASTLSLL
jgi:hypothetical protein